MRTSTGSRVFGALKVRLPPPLPAPRPLSPPQPPAGPRILPPLHLPPSQPQPPSPISTSLDAPSPPPEYEVLSSESLVRVAAPSGGGCDVYGSSHPAPSLLRCPQGCLDGGLEMPYNEKRFVGYQAENKELDGEVLEKYLYNGHVGEYMEEMEEESPDKYDAHFAKYHEAELNYDNMEDVYKEVSSAAPWPSFFRVSPSPNNPTCYSPCVLLFWLEGWGPCSSGGSVPGLEPCFWVLGRMNVARCEAPP